MEPDPELLDASLWQAARDGMQHHLMDLRTAEPVPADRLLGSFLDHVGPALESEGDLADVTAGLAIIAEQGTGSERQRRALHDGGMTALLSLYRESLTGEQ